MTLAIDGPLSFPSTVIGDCSGARKIPVLEVSLGQIYAIDFAGELHQSVDWLEAEEAA
jgi:hypothetical protein